MDLRIAVEGLVLKVSAGRIRESTASRLTGSGALKCEGVTPIEKKSNR